MQDAYSERQQEETMIQDGPEQQPIDDLAVSISLDGPFHQVKDTLLREFERAYLARALRRSAMNVSLASRASGLSRKHLRALMSKHGLRLRRNLDRAAL
ncbi:MAG TPA: helix-turn-helix domain-containing protein [Kofleriaceae bacterium]|jgi:DNA-binding NtrC family response regulator